MQSAAVLPFFCFVLFFWPLFLTTLKNAQLKLQQSNSCSFCHTGVFLFSLAICLAAICFLTPPFCLKINVSESLAVLHLANHWMTSILPMSSTPFMTPSQHAQYDLTSHHFRLFTLFLCDSAWHFVSPFIYKAKQLLPGHTYITCRLCRVQQGQIVINISECI